MATVNYTGDANYSSKEQKLSIEIVKATPTLDLVEVNGNIVAVLSANVTGNVTFYVNGKPYTENVINGNATLSNDKLIIGNNAITAVYNGDGNYTYAIDIDNFPIDKITTNMTVVATPEVVVGKDTTIVVTMVNVTAGKVLIEVNGYNYTVDINSSGVAKLIVALPVGEYNATAYFLGDANHTKSNNISNTFKVLNKTTPELNITAPVSVEIDNNITFEVNMTGNGTLTVKVNGEVVTKGADGKYHFNKTGVAGTYTITAELEGNDYYFAVSESKSVEVYKHASEIESVIANATVVVGKNTTITVTMKTTNQVMSQLL